MKRDVHLVSAIGPATDSQLKQWAAEYERLWDRKIRSRRIVLGIGLIGLVGLMVAVLKHQIDARPDFGVVGLMQMLGCLFALYILERLISPVSRPVNPYRPIDVTPADLEAGNAGFPSALAYLDAIRHQGRLIVTHDLNVLALIRQQQQSNH